MTDKKNILITGGTGFVGIHLLNKLIAQTDIAVIYLISRNVTKNSVLENYKILLDSFEKYGLACSKENIRKIKIIYGDIKEPRIGIQDKKLYRQLMQKVHVIYHVAAEVHHLKKYEDLKKTNVDCMKEIIEFAKDGKIINFISTMGAASKRDAFGMLLEDFPDVDTIDDSITMGYLKSKYEAEKLIANSETKKLSNIFRLGYISGSLSSGAGLYENNQLMLFIKSCIQLGYAPCIDRILNLTAVDFTCEIIGSKYFRNNSESVMHLVNSREYVSWLELIEFLNNKGFNIKVVDLPAWQQRLKKSDRTNALYRMLLTYRRIDADNHIIRFGKNLHLYHMDNVEKFCKNEHISMPIIKYDYLEKILNYLIQVGFLTKMAS